MLLFKFGNYSVRALVEFESLESKDEIYLTVKDEKIHLFGIDSGISLAYLPQISAERIQELAEHHQMMLAREQIAKPEQEDMHHKIKKQKSKKNKKE